MQSVVRALRSWQACYKVRLLTNQKKDLKLEVLGIEPER
jgi:hypothetical protein